MQLAATVQKCCATLATETFTTRDEEALLYLPFLKRFSYSVREQRGSLTVFIRIIGLGFFIAAALLL
ncbi:hypothetical protein FDUTEX481_06529 [Tolypothrix sp. PCC 7601]|nr:hypothetical protein FDUTEX481_06529 [Tolypothrix sp. PCC 7601]